MTAMSSSHSHDGDAGRHRPPAAFTNQEAARNTPCRDTSQTLGQTSGLGFMRERGKDNSAVTMATAAVSRTTAVTGTVESGTCSTGQISSAANSCNTGGNSPALLLAENVNMTNNNLMGKHSNTNKNVPIIPPLRPNNAPISSYPMSSSLPTSLRPSDAKDSGAMAPPPQSRQTFYQPPESASSRKKENADRVSNENVNMTYASGNITIGTNGNVVPLGSGDNSNCSFRGPVSAPLHIPAIPKMVTSGSSTSNYRMMSVATPSTVPNSKSQICASSIFADATPEETGASRSNKTVASHNPAHYFSSGQTNAAATNAKSFSRTLPNVYTIPSRETKPETIPANDVKKAMSQTIGNKSSVSSSTDQGKESISHLPLSTSSNPTQSTKLLGSVAGMTTSQIEETPKEEVPMSKEDQDRALLFETYSPYLIPTDTSLSSARERLKTALDQTRQLRAAFTARVYNKYRIVLRPVPKTVNDILSKIREEPARAKLKLDEEIKVVREEKEIEKKEAQKIAAAAVAAAAATANDGSGAGDGAANAAAAAAAATSTAEAEQMFGAGLSLVILPEEEIDEDEMSLSEYEHRGPTDPETGQRVGGISSAAAAAAEALLDRARKGTAARMDRRRRLFLSSLGRTGNDGEGASFGMSGLPMDITVPGHVSKGDSTAFNERSSLKKVSGTEVLPMLKSPLPSTTTSRSLTSQKQQQQKQPVTSVKFSPSDVVCGSVTSQVRAGKSSKLASSGGSGKSLLSLSPRAEITGSASAAMLLASGVGSSLGSGSRAVQHQNLRWRHQNHPHSDSKAGLALAASVAGSSSSKKGLSSLSAAAAAAAAAVIAADKKSLSLPPIPNAEERKEVAHKLRMLPHGKAITRAALAAMGTVLEQFYSDPFPNSDETPVIDTNRTHANKNMDAPSKAGYEESQGKIPTTDNGFTANENKPQISVTQLTIDDGRSHQKIEPNTSSKFDVEGKEGVNHHAQSPMKIKKAFIPKFKKRKRRVTEIGLLRGLRCAECPKWDNAKGISAGALFSSARPVITTSQVEAPADKSKEIVKDQVEEEKGGKIDPVMAFSVLYALGILSGSSNSSRNKVMAPSSTSMQDKTGGVDGSKDAQVTGPNTDLMPYFLPSVSLMEKEDFEFEPKLFTSAAFDQWNRMRDDRSKQGVDEKTDKRVDFTLGTQKRTRPDTISASPSENEARSQKAIKFVSGDIKQQEEKKVVKKEEAKPIKMEKAETEPQLHQQQPQSKQETTKTVNSSQDRSTLPRVLTPSYAVKQTRVDTSNTKDGNSLVERSFTKPPAPAPTEEVLSKSLNKPGTSTTSCSQSSSQKVKEKYCDPASSQKQQTVRKHQQRSNESNATASSGIVTLTSLHQRRQSTGSIRQVSQQPHPQQQQIANQHHGHPQLLQPITPSSLEGAYSALPQASAPGTNPYGQTSSSSNGMGVSARQQHLHHSHAHLLNNHERFHHGTHQMHHSHTRPPLLYTDALTPCPPTHPSDFSDYYQGNSIHHSPHPPGYAAPPDWSLNTTGAGLLSSSSASMIGALGLSQAHARAMVAQMRENARLLVVREQQQHAAVVAQAQAAHAAATRNSMNNLTSLSPQQAGIFLNNGERGTRNSNSYQQPRISHLAASSPLISPTMAQQQHLATSTMSQTASSVTHHQNSKRQSTHPTASGAAAPMSRSPSATSQPPPKKQRSSSLSKTSQAAVNTLVQSPKKKSSEIEDSNQCSKILPETKKKLEQNPVVLSQNTSCSSSAKEAAKETPNISKDEKKDGTDHTKKNIPVQPAKKEPSSVSSSTPLPTSSVSATAGLRFFIPSPPSGLCATSAELILQACIHKINSTIEQKLALEYLMAVGTAVPIPKALVANPFKERLAAFGKGVGGVSVSVPKDVVVATISTWLWSEHRKCFQHAFAKSGRIDVDPECKWLIQAAIDAAVRAIMAETDVRGNTRIGEFGVASLVNQSLMREVCIDEEMDAVIPNFENLLTLLDERRMMALKVQCQERVLLAALISRRATMSEFFARAYVSAMVRAGEALGHEELCEMVQDEECAASTLLPYDILSDMTGAWEDPCRPSGGFTPGLTADELTKRAHAQAQIQKSLYKLQEKFDIKGGTPSAGPYADLPPNKTDGTSTGAPVAFTPLAPVSRSTSGGSLKRRTSFSESVGAGPSSMVAGNVAIFNPSHHSDPFVWDSDDIDNTPYGHHVKGKRGKRSSGARHGSSNSPKKQRIASNSKSKGLIHSTEAIDWAVVAKRFQPVSLFDPSSATPSQLSKAKASIAKGSGVGTNIFAPIFHKLDTSPAKADDLPDTDSSDEEEDISDEAVLARHQEVLDHMKRKLDVLMEAKQRSRKTS